LSWTGTASSWVVLPRLSRSMVVQIPVSEYTSLSKSLYLSFLLFSFLPLISKNKP
jgi:hypothetical protein